NLPLPRILHRSADRRPLRGAHSHLRGRGGRSRKADWPAQGRVRTKNMTRVYVPGGEIEGFVEHGNHCFLGVPYAAPCTPERRFEAPQAVEQWDGVRDATRLGSVCPQIPTYGPVGKGATSNLTQGEDFLTLNIRTPDLAGNAPVLVWVHGGGYAVGSANEPIVQSGAFASSGIVEVTINYRLGALGFLH